MYDYVPKCIIYMTFIFWTYTAINEPVVGTMEGLYVWHMSGSTLRRKLISVVSMYLDSNKYISCSMSAGEQLAGVQTAQFMVENLGTRWPGWKTKSYFTVAVHWKIKTNYILYLLYNYASNIKIKKK